MLNTVATRIQAIAPAQFAYVEVHTLFTPAVVVVMGYDGSTVVDINDEAEELFLATLKAQATRYHVGRQLEYTIDGVTVLVEYASRF